jgi:hypothetical protein
MTHQTNMHNANQTARFPRVQAKLMEIFSASPANFGRVRSRRARDMTLETAAAMSEAPVVGLPAGHLIDQAHAENRLVSRGQRRHAQGIIKFGLARRKTESAASGTARNMTCPV